MGKTSTGTVTTESGTPLAYWRFGKGPPLVMVHGTAADHSRWGPVLPALEERFTVYAVDRRGRGGSGDSDGYAVGREVEDIAAVVDSLGEPVNLLGHSYGGLVFHDVTNVHHAKRALAAGVDGLILVCAGAGGHAGTLSPFASRHRCSNRAAKSSMIGPSTRRHTSYQPSPPKRRGSQ